MAKHPGLNDATRTARLVSPSSEENQAYFDKTVAPVLQRIYDDFASKGQTPYHHSFRSMMSWISNETYMAGRFQRADPKPYFQDPLIDAYRAGGKPALQTAFMPLLDLINQRHNATIDRVKPESIAALVKAGKEIEKILSPKQNPIAALIGSEAPAKRSLLARILGIGGKSLQQSFNEEAPTVEKAPVSDKDAKRQDIKDAKIQDIVRNNRDLYLGVHGMWLWQSHSVTAESFVNFAKAHENNALKAQPLNVKPATLKKHGAKYPEYLIRR